MRSFFKKVEEYVIKKPILLFAIMAFISLFIYKNTHLAGMVFDFNDWALIYEQKTLKDAFNSFGYPGLHQVEQFVFYSLYSLFKYNTYAWYLIFALLHAIVAYQVFLLFKLLIEDKARAGFIAYGSAFLFLISPFAADTVVSKVTVHYLMSAVFIFASLRYYLIFQQKGEISAYLVSILLFVLSLFSLEIAYALPIAILLLYFRELLLKNKPKSIFFALSYVFILGLFLILHKVVIGSFIGHYGAETHTKFDVAQLTANLFSYISSYVFFFDFHSYHFKEAFYQFIYQYFYVFILAVLAISVFIFKYSKRVISTDILSLFSLFVIFLLPILNLFLVFLHPIENDRYTYIASPFVLALILYTFSFFNKRVKYSLLAFFMMLCTFYLQRNVHSFSMSGKVSQGLLDDFRWEAKENIFILAQPENLRGARMFCSTDSNFSAFSTALYLQKNIDIRDRTSLVYEVNMNTLNDSIKVKVISKQHLRVSIGDWGTWFWKHHNGATSFETDSYYTEVSNDGLAYDIFFTMPLTKNDLIIYNNGTKWEELSF